MKRRGAGTLKKDDIGSKVKLQAWVHRRRDIGGVAFLVLRDRSGVAQVVVRPDEQPAVAEALAPARLEWVVEVEGTVAARDPEAVNPDQPTGALEVIAEAGRVLSRSRPLPLNLERPEDASEETRLKHRYLELRRPDLQRNLILRHRLTLETLRYFDEHGFVHLETPILTRSTPEGARDYLVPSRVHRGDFYALPQSPQLFKQLFQVAGFERYVQIARCFRDEDLRSDRQPEFTQIDVEMSFVDEEDIYEVTEGLLRRIFRLIGVEAPEPFPRLTWDDAMARYGSDKPDLRFGLEIRELGDLLGGSGFRGFQAAVAEGGVVRGFTVPGAAAASRKQVDGWAELARRHGAAGVLTLRRRDGELQFQVKGALTEGELSAAAERLALEEGDLALVAAGPAGTTAAALGALRVEMARTYDLVPEGAHSFLWVTDFPLVEWDEDADRWFACNHPFTAPQAATLDLLDGEPARVRSRGYDVVVDGFEVGGGSIRIHEPELQSRVFRLLGISDEEARSRFGFLLDALSYGAPPHGGIAFGLDRLAMILAGASSLREVIAFPKTTSALCLMTEAPSAVDPAQLDELGIHFDEPER